jgi:NitT/TauT family transport system ATP-binding protein
MIEVSDVDNQFVNGKESIQVLDHVSFQVEKGGIAPYFGLWVDHGDGSDGFST